MFLCLREDTHTHTTTLTHTRIPHTFPIDPSEALPGVTQHSEWEPTGCLMVMSRVLWEHCPRSQRLCPPSCLLCSLTMPILSPFPKRVSTFVFYCNVSVSYRYLSPRCDWMNNPMGSHSWVIVAGQTCQTVSNACRNSRVNVPVSC